MAKSLERDFVDGLVELFFTYTEVLRFAASVCTVIETCI